MTIALPQVAWQDNASVWVAAADRSLNSVLSQLTTAAVTWVVLARGTPRYRQIDYYVVHVSELQALAQHPEVDPNLPLLRIFDQKDWQSGTALRNGRVLSLAAIPPVGGGPTITRVIDVDSAGKVLRIGIGTRSRSRPGSPPPEEHPT